MWLADFHGDIIFSTTVNAPDHALFAISLREGTPSILEANGTATPIERVSIRYKARFTDGRLQCIRRITAAESYQEFGAERWCGPEMKTIKIFRSLDDRDYSRKLVSGAGMRQVPKIS